jgi:hypothetical protein
MRLAAVSIGDGFERPASRRVTAIVALLESAREDRGLLADRERWLMVDHGRLTAKRDGEHAP